MASRELSGLGQVGAGVDQVMSAGVLGEEGQHRPGPLRAGGHVVLFQGGIAAPVHDGVEVQVEDRFAAGGQARADHLPVEGGEEALLVSVRQPVGVAGQGGFLGQHREPGEQRGGGVGEQVIDVGDPPGAGELERQQGQQPRHRGDDPGAGVAGRRGQGGQVQRHQVRDGEQQPGPGAVQPVRPGTEVDDPAAGQVRVAAGGGRGDAGLGLRAAQQPPEPLLGEDLRDRGAVQRGVLGLQPPGDLIGGQPLPPQLDDPAADPVFGRRGAGSRAGLAGRGEQRQVPGPVLADQVDHRPPGVAEPRARLRIRQPVHEVGAQRLVPPLVHLVRRGEPLRLLLRRSRCHIASLADKLPCRQARMAARIVPVPACLSRPVHL